MTLLDADVPVARAATAASFTVAGWGSALPPTRVTNADLEARLDTSDTWIRERSGIAERRLASPGATTATLATDALRAALDVAGCSISDVDLIVVATSTPETPMPPTASFVASALAGTEGSGVAGASPGTVDLNGACAGFPFALAMAGSYLGSDLARRVAVVGAECMSRIVDPGDRATAVLFGDGAAALILQAVGSLDGGAGGLAAVGALAETNTQPPGIVAADLVSDPVGLDLLTVPAGGAARPASAETVANREHFIRMDGREVFRRAVRAVVDSIGRTLASAGIEAGDVDLFVPHQANARIVDSVLARTGLDPARTAGNIERYGNTSAASIPLVLAEQAEARNIADGDLVLMSGFGAGMTVGTVLMRWSRP